MGREHSPPPSAWPAPAGFVTPCRRQVKEENAPLLETERVVLGMRHDEMGAAYLRQQGLPRAIIDVAEYHHRPERAEYQAQTVAAAQIADLLVRHAAIGDSGNAAAVSKEDWKTCSGWNLLYPDHNGAALAYCDSTIAKAVVRLPDMLDRLV